MASPTGICTLPFEVLNLIVEYAHVSSHLPLAQTCKTVYHQLQSVVERHKTAHARYGTVSDLLPSTIPDILELALFGRDDMWRTIDIWHMRCLEFFGSRSRWEDWKPWVAGLTDGRVSVTQASEPEFRLSDDRIERFFEEAQKRGIGRGQGYNYYTSAISRGSEAMLKIMLLYLLPNLKTIKLVDAGISLGMNVIWLCRSVKLALESGAWPPGLLSLRKLAVGISLTNGISPIGTSVLVSLLRLPNLEEIYMRHMRIDDEDREYDDFPDADLNDPDHPFWDSYYEDISEEKRYHIIRTRDSLKAHSSSIKHIFLDDMIDYDGTKLFMSRLMKNPVALESITIRTQEMPLPKTDELVRTLSQWQSTTLKRLLISLNHEDDVPSDVFAYRPSDLRGFDNLQVLNVKWRDIAIDARPPAAKAGSPIKPEVFVSYFTQAFPQSMTTLVVYGAGSDGQVDSDGQEETAYLGDAVVALIESGRYPKLEAIYLDNGQNIVLDQVGNEGHFREAVTVGKQHGVIVHIMTQTEWPKSHMNNFATLPNIQEVRSVLRHEPEWIFGRPEEALSDTDDDGSSVEDG